MEQCWTAAINYLKSSLSPSFGDTLQEVRFALVHWLNFSGDYPMGRAGQPAELASIYVQLAAQDASYTTGDIHGAGAARVNPNRRRWEARRQVHRR